MASLLDFSRLVTTLCKLFLGEAALLRVGFDWIWNDAVLGIVAGDEPDKCLAEFREDTGTLHDERWKALTWRRPDKESCPCWWLINPCDEDRTQPPKLLSRCLACLRLELQQQRLATTSKMKREREVRTEQNARADDVIHSNEQIWKAWVALRRRRCWRHWQKPRRP